VGYSARILLDSVNPVGNRLTTFECTYPRFVHSELLTHRQFSRNSSSSRAIPIEKMIERVEKDPVLPVWWGKNQMGMQAREELEGPEKNYVIKLWLDAHYDVARTARKMAACGVHKQIVNRILEPWMWITVIISATEYENFFKLRCHLDAQPELKHIADMMQDLYRNNVPTARRAGEWHLPLTGFEGDELLAEQGKIKVCVGRCARVSYLTHEGKRDVDKDIELHDRLLNGSGGIGHHSPFEHAAQAMINSGQSGNFNGWRQYRKMVENET
jgi:thymidylate synthase-like protein